MPEVRGDPVSKLEAMREELERLADSEEECQYCKAMLFQICHLFDLLIELMRDARRFLKKHQAYLRRYEDVEQKIRVLLSNITDTRTM